MLNYLGLLGLLVSMSALGSEPVTFVEHPTAGTVASDSKASAEQLSGAVQAAAENDLRTALENQADQLDALGDELRSRGIENGAHATAEAVRAAARKPNLKSRLLGALRSIGKDLEKAGVTALKIGGYAGNAASDLIIVPYDFSKNLANAAVSGRDDGSETTLSGWVAVGAGGGVELPILLGIASASSVGVLIAPLAVRLTTAILCSDPKLNHEPTEEGQQPVEMNQYCTTVQLIDDDIQDPIVYGGVEAGVWVGQEVRKIGHDLKSFFGKLFRPNQNLKKTPALP